MKAAATVLVALMLLAGCADPEDDNDTPGEGPPDGTPGGATGTTGEGPPIAKEDCVTVRFEAQDPAGSELANGTLRFMAGLHMSGLGDDVEAAILGRHLNDTFESRSTDDTNRTQDEVLLQRVFGPYDLEQFWTIERFMMENPYMDLDNMSEGRFIHVHDWYDGEYVRHNDTHVTVRFTPTEQQLYHELGDYPLAIRTEVDEESGTYREVREVTEPEATFQVPPPPMFSCWSDLGLVPGAYQVLEEAQHHILLWREPDLDLPGEVVFQIHIENVGLEH